MKTASLVVFLLAALGAAARAQAVREYRPDERPLENPSIMAVDRSVSIAYQLTHLYYIEPSNTDAFTLGVGYEDYEQGDVPGAKLAASWMDSDLYDLYLHGEWSGVNGHVNYTGFTQGTPAIPVASISKATIQNYGFKVGVGIPTGRQWMLIPYGSFGGRHWVRTLAPDTPSVFVESYNHYYLALGGLAQYSPWEQWVFTGDAAVGRTMYASINDPPDGLNHQSLGSSPLIKLGLEVDGKITPSLHLFTGFDYMYFTYGQSGVVPIGGGLAVMEPLSRTEEYNFTAGLRISY